MVPGGTLKGATRKRTKRRRRQREEEEEGTFSPCHLNLFPLSLPYSTLLAASELCFEGEEKMTTTNPGGRKKHITGKRVGSLHLFEKGEKLPNRGIHLVACKSQGLLLF